MTDQRQCKFDSTPLVKKETVRKASQLTKPYYYTAYFYCPTCQRIYHDDQFKVMNDNFTLFTTDALTDQSFDVEIWTDGACTNNGTPSARAAWAFVAGDYEENGLAEGKQTNNRAEALAIYHALVWAASQGHRKIQLHSDSQITLHGVIKHPEKVKENRDIFQKIHDVVTENNLEITYKKVLGHSGDVNNERADRLATSLVI